MKFDSEINAGTGEHDLLESEVRCLLASTTREKVSTCISINLVGVNRIED